MPAVIVNEMTRLQLTGYQQTLGQFHALRSTSEREKEGGRDLLMFMVRFLGPIRTIARALSRRVSLRPESTSLVG
jgi:hypothetical protein